jgi:hypothetical protein
MIERTTVRLPSALLNRARKKAAAEGRTLTELLEEGLRLALDADRNGKRSLPVSPARSSKAKGWLRPGIDSLRDIQEMEDIEYVRRLNSSFKD